MNRNDYKQMASQMKVFGLDLTTERLQINIPDAENVLRLGLSERMGSNFVWLPEYTKVVEWMKDNNGRGLLLKGNVGRGKTEIGRNIMPAVINHHYRRIVNCYDAVELSARKSEFLNNNWPLCIDDLGTESMNSMKFSELFNIINTRLLNQNSHCTKTIISTNLSLQNLFNSYDERIVSRFVGNYNICRFFGDDIRFIKK